MKKTTILIYKDMTAPKRGLREATQEEWSAILQANKGLPMCQRRCFMEDSFEDCGIIDRMFIEVSYDEYCRWHKSAAKSYRTRKEMGEPQILSLDVPTNGGEGEDLISIMSDGFILEKAVIDEMMLSALKDSLCKWKPWGTDMLEYYLDGNVRYCTSGLIAKYDVSYTVVARWKKMFEAFVKKFFEGC